MAEWTETDVADWMESIELAEFASAMVDNAITGAELLALDNSDLATLGITKLGHVKRFLNKRKEFVPVPAPAPTLRAADSAASMSLGTSLPVRSLSFLCGKKGGVPEFVEGDMLTYFGLVLTLDVVFLQLRIQEGETESESESATNSRNMSRTDESQEDSVSASETHTVIKLVYKQRTRKIRVRLRFLT